MISKTKETLQKRVESQFQRGIKNMEFECENMTMLGCGARDSAKELMLQELNKPIYDCITV